MKSKGNNSSKAKTIIVAYIPVLHEGYRRFFTKYPEANHLYILGPDITQDFYSLTKEIRALDPKLIASSIESWGIVKKVSVLNKKELQKIKGKVSVIMPDEDVSREVAAKYFKKFNLTFDSVFLRWDKHKALEEKPVEADQKISVSDLDKKLIRLAQKESEKSSDWWRHVGAVLIKKNKVILTAHNEHVPTPFMPYQNGDPRNEFHKGDNLELSTAIHSEAKIIATAAKKGINLTGCSLYVSTFPCPPCAKLIAYSGIKRLFYTGSYGVLDGESVLKSQGVELIFVDLS